MNVHSRGRGLSIFRAAGASKIIEIDRELLLSLLQTDNELSDMSLPRILPSFIAPLGAKLYDKAEESFRKQHRVEQQEYVLTTSE